MKLNTILILILIFISSLLGCKIKEKGKKKVSTVSIVDLDKLSASNTIDFKIIKEWVKDKSIVSIGESTHGIGEFYSLKSEIVKFLHKDLGFEVLVMEGGFGDINLAWKDISNLNYLQLRDKTVFGNFRCKEIEPLFKYLKENSESKNPLFYAGYDTQTSGNYYKSNIDSICRYLKLDINVKEEFTYYSKMYRASYEPDSTNFSNYKERYLNTISTIKKAVEKNKNSLQQRMKWSDLDFKTVLRTLDMQYKSVDYNYANKMNSENMHQAFTLRDKYMAKNLEWIVKNLYPNKKIVIWGYNGHIQKGKSNNQLETKWMGQYLKEIFGDNYFSIGLFAYQGKFYQHWTKKSIEFENSDSIAIEFKMKRDNFKYTFQKFGNKNANNWINKETTAFEVESNGIVTFVPSERFDAAICIDSVNVPTFIK